MPTPLKIILYPVAGAVCFLLFFVLLFPYDSVKLRLAREIEQRLGGGYSISIGTLSPSLLTGVVLKDVEVRPRGVADAGPVKLSRAKLKFAILSLLSGDLDVVFDLRAGKGKAEGSLDWKKTGFDLDLKMSGFDIALAGFLAQKAGIPISGFVNGAIEAEIYPQDPLRNTGKIHLEIPDLRLGEISAGGGVFQTPPIQLAQAGGPLSVVEVVINKGNLEVKTIRFSGGDLDLTASGKIYGARKTENYRFNLQGTLKISEGLAEKVPFLIAVEKQKGADGSYPFTITGRLSKPSIRVGDFKIPI